LYHRTEIQLLWSSNRLGFENPKVLPGWRWFLCPSVKLIPFNGTGIRPLPSQLWNRIVAFPRSKNRIDFHFNPLSFPAIFDPPRRHQLMRNPHDFSTGRPPPQKPKTQSSQSIHLLKNVGEQVNFMMSTAKKCP